MWLEAVIVGGIVLASGGWLAFRAVRFFQGRSGCTCGGSAMKCPIGTTMAAIDRALEPWESEKAGKREDA